MNRIGNFLPHDLHQRLRSDRPQVGLWLSLASSTCAEIAATAGFDWLLIDMEHSPNELRSVLEQLRALSRSTAAPIVRPASNDAVVIKRLLDIGAGNLMIPFVQSPAEAAQAVASTRYAPHGTRGFSGCTRANDYGRATSTYFSQAHDAICVIVQVETLAALEQLEAIATVPGVSAVFIGAADISVEFGRPGNLSHPDVRAVVQSAGARLRAIGVPAGVLVTHPADVEHALSVGYQLIAVGSDARLLASGCDGLAARYATASQP